MPTNDPNSDIRAQIDPKLLEAARPEINRRVKKMLDSGIRPQALYLAVGGPNQLVSLRTTNPDHNILLIFTSGHAAMDYLRTAKIAGGVHEFPFQSLSAYLEQWKRAQLDSIVFDRCPRCPHYLALPIDKLTEEQFLWLWAVHRATRIFQAERLIRTYLNGGKNTTGKRSSPEMRAALEALRDHVDCSVPYVHWLIAIHAGIEGDQEAQIASISNLEAFGPEFIGKVPTNETTLSEKWMNSAVEAQMGLLATFEMTPPDLQSGVKIDQKTIN